MSYEKHFEPDGSMWIDTGEFQLVYHGYNYALNTWESLTLVNRNGLHAIGADE